MTPDPDLRRFAYFVAGPRDFAINFVINGVVAWFVFGKSEVVPLAGPDSIFNMLLPMSAIESTLTSFFGLLNGQREVQKKAASENAFCVRRWFAFAVGYSLLQGVLGLSVFVVAKYAAQWLVPTTTLPSQFVPPIIGIISGILAYILHSKSVIRSSR